MGLIKLSSPLQQYKRACLLYSLHKREVSKSETEDIYDLVRQHNVFKARSAVQGNILATWFKSFLQLLP